MTHGRAEAARAASLDLTRSPAHPIRAASLAMPYAVGASIPFISALLTPKDVQWPTMVTAFVLTVMLVSLVLVGIRQRRSAVWHIGLAFAYLPVIALVREAEGGGQSGYGPLVLLPLLAVSLYGGPRALLLCVAGIGLTLSLPILLIGGENYVAATEIRRTVIWLALSYLVGSAVQELVRRTRASELQYRSVFENVREVIFQTDGQGRWTLLNPAWEEITGHRVSASLGTEFLGLVHPDDHDANAEQFARLMRREIDSYQHEMRFRTATGEFRWLEATARRTLAADGSDAGVSGTLTDVTDRHESDRMKEQFFALVSHELRTPLAAIVGYLELLEEEDGARLSDDGREFITVMQRNSQRLMRLIGDLLFAAQVESGTLSLVRGPVDLADLVRHACDSARPRAADRRLTLRCDPGNGEPLVVDGDRDRLGQVLDNLLTNAIKFTPEGGTIEVRLASWPAQDDGAEAMAAVEVQDTGPGIPEAEQARLFERFARARAADENAVQGVGLGLAISRAIVQGHGGRIGLTSVVGQGTTFRVELPLPVTTKERTHA